jgi:hypothetical protein
MQVALPRIQNQQEILKGKEVADEFLQLMVSPKFSGWREEFKKGKEI